MSWSKSWPEHSVRRHKQQIDRAIHAAYARLASDAAAAAAFEQLLYSVRKRAPGFLQAPVPHEPAETTVRSPAVEALINLSRFRDAHLRPVHDWAGCPSSWRLAVASLAHHLVCKYPVPFFLASSWSTTEDPAGDQQRRWFVAHACGASFRSLDLPLDLTRKMERIFLASPDHLAIGHALRRAEMIALGLPPAFIQAALSTRLAADLNNSVFWRTVWHFLIANAGDIDASQIAPLIDFIQAVRHDRVVMETPNGTVELDPPLPTFSIKGRTIQSMLRLMQEWHRSLGLGSAGLAWKPSNLRPMLIEEPSLDDSAPPRRWQIVELTNSAQLRAEGSALHHCVASYAHLCHSGASRIWSIRSQRGDKIHHVLTVEVDQKRRAIIQARGLANRTVSGKLLRLLREWATRERLQMAI